VSITVLAQADFAAAGMASMESCSIHSATISDAA
jgi:hypothetical protein